VDRCVVAVLLEEFVGSAVDVNVVIHSAVDVNVVIHTGGAKSPTLLSFSCNGY